MENGAEHLLSGASRSDDGSSEVRASSPGLPGSAAVPGRTLGSAGGPPCRAHLHSAHEKRIARGTKGRTEYRRLSRRVQLLGSRLHAWGRPLRLGQRSFDSTVGLGLNGSAWLRQGNRAWRELCGGLLRANHSACGSHSALHRALRCHQGRSRIRASIRCTSGLCGTRCGRAYTRESLWKARKRGSPAVIDLPRCSTSRWHRTRYQAGV